MTRRLAALALALCALAPAAPARPDDTPRAPREAWDAGRPGFRQFTDKDGLPQNSAQALAFDRRGYLWVCTQDGAAYYNGRAWAVVNMPHRSVSNYLNSVLEAADGSMWFATDRGGVARLQGDAWTVYRMGDGLPSDHVRCLAETAAPGGGTTLWAGTSRGLARFDGSRFSTVAPDSGIPDDYVMGLHVSEGAGGEPVLWVGSFGGGLLKLESGRWSRAGAEAGLPAKILAVDEGVGPGGGPALWAATDEGAWYLEGGRWGTLRAADGLPSDHIRAFAATRETGGARAEWIATDAGVAVLDGARLTAFSPANGYPFDQASALATDPSEAGNGTVWIGLNGPGLVRLRRGGWRALDTRSGLPHEAVFALLETAGPGGSRTAWVATSRGLARWDGGGWQVYDGTTGLKANSARALLETTAPDGTPSLWAGTRGGLRRLRDGRWTDWDSTSGLPDNEVLVMRESEGGSLLLGTGAGGLARFDGQHFTVVADAASGLPDNRVQSLAETAGPGGERTLWVGTNNGLAALRGGSWHVYDAGSGLPNNVILGLREVRGPDGRRWLWAGTYGGAARLALDDPDARWTSYTDSTTPALPNNTVYQVASDGAGRVYLATNRGVARFTPRAPTPENPAEFDVYTYTTEDGLPANECNVGASLVDGQGRVWVGTVGGAAMLDPASEAADHTPKPLYIERSLLGGKPRRLEPGEELEHDENNLVFEYSLLSYFREGDTRYRTQLVGLEGAPGEWAAHPKREYPSLPAGSYVFHVWAKDYAGNVSGPVSVAFKVKPAPWLTWWALAAYALALAGLGYLFVRLRLEALRRSNRLLEAKVRERTLELAESERRALEASRAKSTFLANMSHELRTPLNAILGFIQLMERDASLAGEHRESLAVIQRSGEHLLGLINDVLSIAKIEAGRLHLREDAFDLHRMLRGICEMFQPRAHAKQIAFEAEVDPGIPRYVRGDEGKLRQVLINLLGNALKFTDAGSVTLRARLEDGVVDFEVEDTGPGIPEAELGKLFSAFSQAAAGLRAREGTGLGLAISRSFVQLMGGDLRVASEAGRGATFGFGVPFPLADAGEVTGELPKVVGLEPGQPEYRVLVVDDRPENRALLVKLLVAVGFSVREAVNGREAVAAWEAWRPHVIWMDIRMPVMDGYEATREIRRREGARGAGDPGPAPSRTPILALTASALEDDREAVFGAGCDGFVPKPFRHDVIFEKMAEAVGARYLYDDRPAPASEPEAAADAGEAATPERLAGVPPERRSRLAAALVHGDLATVLAVVEEVRPADAALAEALRHLAKNYRFDELMDALERVEEAARGAAEG